MYFRCPRCARRHAFPAARMNAAGRLPCRCGVTLVLEPPRERHAAAAAGPAGVDIVTLGYGIVAERAAGLFDGLRQELRAALGVDGARPGVPDPAKAARPARLWPALGLAFDPRLFLPAGAALFAGSAPSWFAREGAGTGTLLAGGLAAVAVAVAAAAAVTATAAATHEAIAEGAPMSLRRAAGALLRRPALFIGAARDAGLRVALCALLLAAVALLAGLEPRAGAAAVVARTGAVVQALLVVGALGCAASVAHRLLGYAALAPQGRDLLMVQAALELRRISGERELVPSRALAPALAAVLGLALALGAAARLATGTWDAAAGVFGALQTPARAFGRDLVWALAGGVWCSYLGVAGLLAGYALGIGAAQGPVRAPDIITGTWGVGAGGLARGQNADIDPAPGPESDETEG